MAEDIAVKKDQIAATDQGVKATDTDAPGISQEDYSAVLAAKDAELAKVQTERDNYRKGMLKAKGKPIGDDESGEDVDQFEMMRRIAREEALGIQEARLATERDEIVKKALRENAELKLALKNRSQVSSGGQSSGTEEKSVVADHYLSEGQIKELKARGWDDKKIEAFKKNLQRNSR